MSRFQKIFLASAFVIVGFAVAKFLGQPVLPKQVFDLRALQPPANAAPTKIAAAGASQAAGGVRLLPDSSTAHTSAPATSPDTAAPQPPRLGSALAPVLATNGRLDAATMPRTMDFDSVSSAPIGESASPRGKLRNEAPRAVGIDPQSPAAIRRLPSENVEVSDPYKVTDTKAPPTAWAAPPLLNAGLAAVAPAAPPASPTMPASYSAPPISPPLNPQADSQFAPPPWPVPDEVADSRSHIVVDGDSLERLAGRYLSDPKRGREIYELNRAVLSSPDLLPIGAELKIPERFASAAGDRRGFQPNSAIGRSIREVGRENVTSVQPMAAPQAIIPRAQLAPPEMVQ